MTHEQAVAHCAELNADANRERQWFPRQAGPDEWEIVSMTISGFRPTGPSKESVEARPQPTEPPDLRPTIIRNIPPYGPG